MVGFVPVNESNMPYRNQIFIWFSEPLLNRGTAGDITRLQDHGPHKGTDAEKILKVVYMEST
jgi:hypothetical protein